MKSILKLIILIGFMVLFYGLYLFAKSGKTEYCGEITYKTENERIGKRRIITDNIFIIYFENGYSEEIKVNLKTYVSHNEGYRICLKLDNGYFDYKIGYARGYVWGGILYLVIGIFTVVMSYLVKLGNF